MRIKNERKRKSRAEPGVGEKGFTGRVLEEQNLGGAGWLVWARNLKQFRHISRQIWGLRSRLGGGWKGPVGHDEGWTLFFNLGNPWEALRRGASFSELFYRQTILCTVLTVFIGLLRYDRLCSTAIKAFHLHSNPMKLILASPSFIEEKNRIFSNISSCTMGDGGARIWIQAIHLQSPCLSPSPYTMP